MGKLNWSKGRKLRAGEYEEKYDPGTVMANGRVIPVGPQDSLASRAGLAEIQWLAERKAKAAKQRASRRAAKKPPNRGELMRLKRIREQLGEVAD